MNNNFISITGLQTLPTAYTPPNMVIVKRNPTSTDWQTFVLGTLWLNPVNQSLWYLASLSGNVATWIMFSGGSTGILTLTGNSGGAVSPLLGNVNVVGDGVGVTITGNPGSHTLTASLVGSGVAAQSFVENTGSATPNSSGVLNVLGDTTTITTTGSGNTVTISAVGSGLVQTLTGNSGGAVHPSAGNINVVGDGTTISIVGNPGTHTLTASAMGSIPITFVEDTGTATPSANTLNVKSDGAGLVSTAGSGNTITINTTYSTGTWTPVLAFGGSTTGITYSGGSVVGEYIKIGQLVFINFGFTLTSKGSASGFATVGGFPFSNTGTSLQNHPLVAISQVNLDGGFTYVGLAFNLAGLFTANIEEYGSGLAFAQLTNSNFTNNSSMFGTFVYSTGTL